MKKTDEFVLTNECIDAVCAKIEAILKKQKVYSKEIIKIRFKAEEAMSFYQAKFGANAPFSFKYSTGTNRQFVLMFPGEELKPFSDENDEFAAGIIQMLGEPDHWQYKHHVNIVEFKIPQKPVSQVAFIGIALLGVVLFTLVAKFLLPAAATETIQTVVLSPLSGLFLTVLRSTACFLIFTSIVMSVVNIGDIRSFKRIGKSLFSNLFGFMFLSVALTFVCMIPWIRITAGEGVDSAGVFRDLFQAVLDMVPPNPISPFMEGNAIQVIILAIFCGIISSLLGEKISAVKKFLQEFDLIVSSMIEKINILLPVLIFAVLADTALSNSISDILSQKTVVLMWGIAMAIQIVISGVCVTVFGKMNFISYLKKAKAPLMIALFTASSVTALPANTAACKHEFKLEDKLVDLGVPIGQVMFMPCSAAVMVATCVGISFAAGIAVSPAWILTVTVIAIVMAVATPPVPGAALTIYSLLFAQMGLPSAYFGVTIALGAITDSLVTTINLISLHYLLMKVNKAQDGAEDKN